MIHRTQSCRFSPYHRAVAWCVLAAVVAAWGPVPALAQSWTARLLAPSGVVLVNGLTAQAGSALTAGDVLETGENAAVIVELSDGSQLDIGAKTKIDIAQLAKTGSGAKVSKIKLAWGWLRAKLSPGYQSADARFEIETPNALVGVKFSLPDIEVRYAPEAQETTAVAHTAALRVRNLLTGEDALVPVGSTAIITATAIQIIAGLADAGSAAAGSSADAGGASLGGTTQVVLGVAALGAIGGIVALASGSDSESESESSNQDAPAHDFSGQFEASDNWSSGGWIKTIRLTQSGSTISGQVRVDETSTDCQIHGSATLSGEVLSSTTARAYPTPTTIPATCTQGGYDYALPNPFELTLRNNGNTLYVGDPWGIEFIRQ